MKITLIALLFLPFALQGCVHENFVELGQAAAKVKAVRESDKPLRCKVLGEVHGVSRAQSEDKARQGAENDLRNQASQFVKANYVLIEIDRPKPIGTTTYREVFLGGKALACDDNPA